MPRIAVSLPAHLKAFVDAEVAARGYESAAEFIALLVQKAQIERNRAPLERLLTEGLESGPATPMTTEDWDNLRAQVDKQVSRARPRKPKRA